MRPGGWAFQYNNAHYPDLDDTAVVVMALDRAQGNGCAARAIMTGHRARARMGRGPAKQERRLGRVRRRQHLLLSQQHSLRRSRRAARSADRRCHRPLHRHAGAIGRAARQPAHEGGVDYLERVQLADGSWFGRWGVNYIYGTWSALAGLNAAGIDAAIIR